MEFWKVPNTAGLPTVPASAIVNEGIIGSHVGKGALFSQPEDAATTSATTIEWLALNYDDLGFTNFPDNNTSIIIPKLKPAINAVRFFGQCEQDSGGAQEFMTVRLQKNSAHLSPRVQQMGETGGIAVFRYQHWTSFVIPVVAGDVFTLEQFTSIGPTRFLQSNTWFGVIVIS